MKNSKVRCRQSSKGNGTKTIPTTSKASGKVHWATAFCIVLGVYTFFFFFPEKVKKLFCANVKMRKCHTWLGFDMHMAGDLRTVNPAVWEEMREEWFPMKGKWKDFKHVFPTTVIRYTQLTFKTVQISCPIWIAGTHKKCEYCVWGVCMPERDRLVYNQDLSRYLWWVEGSNSQEYRW